MISVLLVAALSVVTPREGETVPTLKAEQKAYLALDRKARFKAMDDPKERARLFAVGAGQQAVRLSWSGETNRIYAVSVARDGGDEQEIVVSNRTSVWVVNLELGQNYRWMVREEETGESATASFRTDVTPPRLLRAEGVSNFRDLGGWPTKDGKRVRQNMIFRSAGLRSSSKGQGALFAQKTKIGERRVTDAGLMTLKGEFHVKTDLELRSRQECAGMVDTLLTGAQWVHVPFAAYDFIDNMVRGKEPFAKMFRTFLSADSYPVLMHCSGGRDRTGTVAFLLNGLLGVSEEDLLRDWEFSIFCDQGASFNADRIARLLRYLNTLPGQTINDRIASYVRSCGITDAEISVFRGLMLE